MADGRSKKVMAADGSKAGSGGRQSLGEWLDELLFGEVTALGPLDGPCCIIVDEDLHDADEAQL